MNEQKANPTLNYNYIIQTNTTETMLTFTLEFLTNREYSTDLMNTRVLKQNKSPIPGGPRDCDQDAMCLSYWPGDSDSSLQDRTDRGDCPRSRKNGSNA